MAKERANKGCDPCELVRCLGVRNPIRIEYICRRCGAKTVQYFLRRTGPQDWEKNIAWGTCPHGKKTIVRFDDQCPQCFEKNNKETPS